MPHGDFSASKEPEFDAPNMCKQGNLHQNKSFLEPHPIFAPSWCKMMSFWLFSDPAQIAARYQLV